MKTVKGILKNCYKEIRIPTGNTVAGVKCVESIKEFDIDKAEQEINSLLSELEIKLCTGLPTLCEKDCSWDYQCMDVRAYNKILKQKISAMKK